jgi:hypothetical protein
MGRGRTITDIDTDIAAERARHRDRLRILRRELSEARGTRHRSATAEAVGNGWRAGKPIAEIMRANGLTKGQVVGLVHRHRFQRPWVGLKTLAPSAFGRYRKGRYRDGLSRAEALAGALT